MGKTLLNMDYKQISAFYWKFLHQLIKVALNYSSRSDNNAEAEALFLQQSNFYF